MGTRGKTMLALVALVCSMTSSAQEAPGTCISADEAELLSEVNAYRQQNGRPAVPISRTLMTVAQHHVRDAVDNGAEIFAGNCNLHSWSDARPDLWSSVCYTPDHANASGMWNKPREISQGAFTGNGYENAAAGYVTVSAALNGWKNSPGHNAVILNTGVWQNYPWRAMGVGVDEGRYYFLWFSDRQDTAAPMANCSAPFFSSGFEDGG